MGLIPFFVVDRPISLEILREVMLKHSSIKIGLMTHALTSGNFVEKFNKFPLDKEVGDDEEELSQNLIKMSDSGIFNKNGCNLTYEELFRKYEMLGVKYGIIIDTLKDAKKTIESALKGLRIYKSNREKYHFKLVAVAQGRNLDEYMKCYQKLQEHFEYIAVGGLLKKIENSARYVRVRDENFMYKVLTTIKKDYSPEWLFALGCYHPSRHKKFDEIGVWGSDYKGWIFNYTPRLEVLLELNRKLKAYELNNGVGMYFRDVLNEIDKIHQSIENLKRVWKSEQEIKKKRIYYDMIKENTEKLNKMLEKLNYWRMKKVHGDGISAEYTELIKRYNAVLNHNDRLWRFKEIQRYVEREVYGKIK